MKNRPTTALGSIEQDALNAGALRARVAATDVEMMLAEIYPQPFSRAGWLFEIKLDGYRLVVGRSGNQVSVISRNGHDLGDTFPEIVAAVRKLPFEHIVLDGEVVAMDEKGRPSFQRLQQRGQLSRAPDVRRAAEKVSTTFFAFDLLGLEGLDLRPIPLIKRKELLRRVLPEGEAIKYLDHFEGQGEALFQHAVKLGLEGIVAKRAECPYRGGRSPHWRKIRADQSDDFVVVGYTQAKGSRHGFGALLLGQYVGGRLVYAGRVGTGFNAKHLTEVRASLDKLERKTPPCDGPVPPGETESTIPLKSVPDFRTSTWVEPKVVCEVRFKELTEEGYLRQPAFLRFRDDKKPSECVRQFPSVEPSGAPLAIKRLPQRDKRVVKVSNRDKIFWPEDGYTKGDLIDYYQAISPWLKPYLERRPVVLTRYPDGIHGKSFFQKDAPDYAPEWVRTERMWSEYAKRDIDYFVVDSVEALLYLANMAAIPLHIWASRLPDIGHPDWCSLDLDPKDAPFAHVVEVAQAAQDLCRRIKLPAFIKTTGSSGLHVMIPLGRQFTHDQARSMGEVLAQALVKKVPKIATTTRAVTKRAGKVYVDYLQNGHGKLLVAPFSVRPIPGAPVSMPLQWSEVNEKLNIRAFTIKNAVARMAKLKKDPLIDILDTRPDLSAALAGLQGEL
jgi:bifunctional non-homologous end joining protein LigD